MDKPIFNYIHVAATYTKVGNLQKIGNLGPKEFQSSALVRLENRLRGMLLRKEVGEQGLSNILWAFASFFKAMPAVLDLVPAVAEQIPGKAGDMIPQALSNSLWAAAKLKNASTKVLKIVPALVQQIPLKAGGMKPQEVSNSLWAAVQLKDACPEEVLKIVPVLLEQIPLKASNMRSQHLSNSLWAAAQLADASPAVRRAVLALVQTVQEKISGMNGQQLSNIVEALVFLEESFPIPELPAIVKAAAARLNCILPSASGKGLMFDVPMVVWACCRTNVDDAKFFSAVAERFSSQRALSSVPDWGVCALILGSSFEWILKDFSRNFAFDVSSGLQVLDIHVWPSGHWH